MGGNIDGNDNYQLPVEMGSEDWDSDNEVEDSYTKRKKRRRIFEISNDSEFGERVTLQHMVVVGDVGIDLVREQDFEVEGVRLITAAEKRVAKNNREWERLVNGQGVVFLEDGETSRDGESSMVGNISEIHNPGGGRKESGKKAKNWHRIRRLEWKRNRQRMDKAEADGDPMIQ